MATAARTDDQVEELKTPDFKAAVALYKTDIRPAQAKVGEFAQEQSTAYKHIKKEFGIQPQAAKAAFALYEMEESKRDDYLRCRNGLEAELGIAVRVDLVDMAHGKDAVIPAAAGKRAPPKLVTIPKGPPGDTDLNPGGEVGSLIDKLAE
ncbi:hypothetical protein [Sphingomonas sp. HMP6]|uniref:hypothetical protein n=1 Tax=Sphingomonas sp. HMP6 TaxID=1517551 RepID=UPI00159676EC|nr:hypothetical protein [Sphingomonas sp. HMP6]BCA57715.1 hypothetical protein HMP06_0484 [Sphingomonas sp. HMP6]